MRFHPSQHFVGVSRRSTVHAGKEVLTARDVPLANGAALALRAALGAGSGRFFGDFCSAGEAGATNRARRGIGRLPVYAAL